MSTPAPAAHRLRLPSGPALGLIGVLAVFLLLIGIKGELSSFVTLGNLRVLVHEGTVKAVIALGMLLIIITGGIDLSVGAVVALVTVVTMRVYTHFHAQLGIEQASLVAVAAGVLVGGLCGLINGLLITQLRLPPFVVTLGMLSIVRGSAIWLAERTLLAFPVGARPEWVSTVASSRGFEVPLPHLFGLGPRISRVVADSGVTAPGFLSLFAIAAVAVVVLRATRFGRHLYAVGSNEATARLCGVNVSRTKVLAYTIAGLLTGWAGVLLFAYGDSGNPSAGEGLELTVIAAVVIGGASLNGGKGTVVGALMGVLILGLLANGVSLFNVPVEVRYILEGGIILLNAALSRWQRPEAG
jgi:ribose/xylose/arabinose/galactoside ABC-type transport system permease subunit